MKFGKLLASATSELPECEGLMLRYKELKKRLKAIPAGLPPGAVGSARAVPCFGGTGGPCKRGRVQEQAVAQEATQEGGEVAWRRAALAGMQHVVASSRPPFCD